MITDQEKELYNRQLILPNFSEEQQDKLKNAVVLVIGAGGLASCLLRYIVGMGVGNIYIFDDDKVDRSNLQRQTLYDEDDIGKYKAFCASEKLSKQNSNININGINQRFNRVSFQSNIDADVDLIIDACDNFETRYEIETIAQINGIPWLFSSIFEYEGQISVFNWKSKVQYSDIFPDPPLIDPTSDGEKIGVLPSLPGIMGCLQATEVFKVLLDMGEPLDGKLLIYDTLSCLSRIINLN
ncbi:MAG: ThiF family adenylyltransferase [Hyphomicrobiales bacterium]